MTVFFLRRQSEAEQPSSPRVGFTVGKVLGGAVDRNRIKRRMREAVRMSSSACEGPVDIVFNPRKSVLTMPFAELVARWREVCVWRRSGREWRKRRARRSEK
jgi:ribonuclease P protein component